METEQGLISKYKTLLPMLNERERRLVLAADARSLGRGGLSLVAKASGVSRVTLNAGLHDLDQPSESKTISRSRKKGGGRKKEMNKDEGLVQSVEKIVNPHTLGDPMKPLLWTSKSLRNIQALLKEKGYIVSHKLVGELLKTLDYSLQSNRKTDEGKSHIDRDAQFEHINATVVSFFEEGQPVISVDCKKKELVGNYKNAGRDWFPEGEPTKVKVYDFIDKEQGKAVPYGVYDVKNNEGWVSVGISHDTASFAVATIRNWWHEMGKERFAGAKKIFITADSGGSNASRSRLWKKELQLMADDLGLEITMSHFPPGTSKWNKIEHRLFSYISMNWKAKPLTSIELIVNLISSTKTKTGLRVKSKKDENQYPKGIKVTNKEMDALNINRSDFHGEWNYKIKPKL